MRFATFLPVLVLSLAVPCARGQGTAATGAPASERAMAEAMAEWIDTVWDRPPQEGAANVRFLVREAGAPFVGVVSIHGAFVFRARKAGTYTTQAFNPNANGRWVYEGLEPGTYTLSIEGQGRHQGWSWQRDAVAVAAGEAPLFVVDLDR